MDINGELLSSGERVVTTVEEHKHMVQQSMYVSKRPAVKGEQLLFSRLANAIHLRIGTLSLNRIV